MALLAPRTAPYPGDVRLNGQSLMLLRPKDGSPPLVRRRALDLMGTVSNEFAYTSTSPLKERPHTYASLVRGMGLDEQQTVTDLRYSYALGVDLSCATWQKGPSIVVLAPAVATGWAPQFGFELGGTLYGLAGQRVLVRNSDVSWSSSLDLTSGKFALGVETFFSNVSAGVQLAFLAVSGAKAYHFNGSAWTQFATYTALAWLQVGRDLYHAHNVNLIHKVSTDADPTNEANFTADNPVGDKSSAIVSLAQTIGQVLLILKTDGVYTLAADGSPYRLFPNLQFERGPENGKVVGYFGDNVYCTYGDALYRITPDLVIESVGPERLTGNSSPVHGRVTAFCGVGGLFGQAWVYNQSDAYLLKMGGFEPDAAGALHRTDAWHGSLSPATTAFQGKSARSMMTSTVGAPSGHTRTYVGFSDGTVAWWTNPCTPNPLGCDQYRWTTADGKVFLPRWNGANLEDAKSLHSLSVMGPLLNESNWVEFAFRRSGQVAYTDFGTRFTRARDKDPFPVNTNTPLAEFEVILKSTSATVTPQVASVVVWYAWRPDNIMDATLTIMCSDGLRLRNGAPLRLTAARIKRLCESAVATPGSVRVQLETGETEDIAFLDLQEGIDWDREYGGFSAAITLRGITFATLVKYGTYGRLRSYTYGDLARLTYGELRGL